MSLPRPELDDDLRTVLRVLGASPDSLLGSGGEAHVFALDRERVARVHHRGTTLADVQVRSRLLGTLASLSSGLSFELPRMLDVREIDGRVVAIERRLIGEPLVAALSHAQAARGRRDRLITRYLDAVLEMGSMTLSLPYRGEVGREDGIRCPSFRGYLAERARVSLAAAGPLFKSVDPQALAEALFDSDDSSVIHMDACPSNILVASDGRVTAIADFGAMTACGDRRLDAIAAVVYLSSEMTAAADDGDRATARAWLDAHGLVQWLEAGERWLAALWSFASDDLALQAFCRRVLL